MKRLIGILMILCLLTSCVNLPREKHDGVDEATATADTNFTVATQTAVPVDPFPDVPSDFVSGNVMDYYEYLAAPSGSQVTIETYVQAKQDYDAEMEKVSLYTQDRDGGYFIYQANCTLRDYVRLSTGTKIRVTGIKTEWAGLIEITDATFEILQDDPYIAQPLDLTGNLGSDALINDMNKLVSFKGLTVVGMQNGAPYSYSQDGNGTRGDDIYLRVKHHTYEFELIVESSLYNEETYLYELVETLQVGDVIEIEAFLYWYNGANPHLTSITILS